MSGLQWPSGRPRAKRRRRANYSTPFAKARDHVLNELRLLGARSVVISSDLPLRSDGLPYANMPQPVDPGVAVYWDRAGKQEVIACDCWNKVEDNLHAVGLTVAALRMIQRAGSSEITEQAFQGFAALPEKAGASSWRATLGLGASATVDDVHRVYRELAKRCHPDNGGSDAAMVALNQAKVDALAELSGATS